MNDAAKTILYVDDNPRSRRLLSSVLAECGFEVIAVEDPVEALHRCKTIPFDLALLDYEMPSLTGSELALEMKFLAPDIPIVLISRCAILPDSELSSVDAHFGPGTDLDDLIHTIWMLVGSKPLGKTDSPRTRLHTGR